MKTLKTRRALVLAGTLAAGLFAGSLFGGTAIASHQFSDVSDSNIFHDDIDWLVDNNIATGFDDGTFRPSQPVTRQAMAAFMRRYNDQVDIEGENSNPAAGTTFTDTLDCGPNRRALAGGGRVDVADVFLTDSIPTPDLHGWTVRFESDDNTLVDPSLLTVWAQCAPLDPAD
jgi:hypothetical protein